MFSTVLVLCFLLKIVSRPIISLRRLELFLRNIGVDRTGFSWLGLTVPMRLGSATPLLILVRLLVFMVED